MGYRTPAEVFHGEQVEVDEESTESRCSPGKGSEALAGEAELPLNAALILYDIPGPPHLSQGSRAKNHGDPGHILKAVPHTVHLGLS